jgi:pyruvate dehydrogenase E1 component alpha subunit
MSDPQKYRTKEEVEGYRSHDPIVIFQDRLLKEDQISLELISQMDEEIEKQITDAVRYAEEGAEPSLPSLYDDVYAGSYPRSALVGS